MTPAHVNRLPKISEAEWAVISELWESEQPMTSAELVANLQDGTGWHPKTIRTLLLRLVEKRAVSVNRRRRPYLYRPAVSKDACVHDRARSFLAQVFSGGTKTLLMHFVEHAELDPEELRELQALFDAKCRRKRRRR